MAKIISFTGFETDDLRPTIEKLREAAWKGTTRGVKDRLADLADAVTELASAMEEAQVEAEYGGDDLVQALDRLDEAWKPLLGLSAYEQTKIDEDTPEDMRG